MIPLCLLYRIHLLLSFFPLSLPLSFLCRISNGSLFVALNACCPFSQMNSIIVTCATNFTHFGTIRFHVESSCLLQKIIRNPFDKEFEYSIEISEAHPKPNCRRCGCIPSFHSPQSGLFHSLSFSISRTLFFLSVSIGEEIVWSVQWLNTVSEYFI